jgi:hypothetical protein
MTTIQPRAVPPLRHRPSFTVISSFLIDQEDVQDPGFDQHPVSLCSFTITKMKALSTLSSIDWFHRNYCIKGGLSTEVGSRAHIRTILNPLFNKAVTKRNKFVKSLLL